MVAPNAARAPAKIAFAFAFVLASATAGLPSPALANGRFPAASMLVARPGDPSHLVLRATYGLLFSNDGGVTWDWLCEKAVGYRGSEDPSIAITGSGAVVAGMFRGFARSTDDGCSWQAAEKGPESILDLALRPRAPDRVYAISSLFAKAGDAGASLFTSLLLVSDDAGAHWTTRATLDPSLLLDSVEVAPSDPKRVYISAIRPRGRETQGVLLVSNDDGAHFTERTIPFGGPDRGIYIGAVDPKRGDRVYLRTSGVDTSRIVVSDDAGKTTKNVFEAGPLLGFALSEDGQTIFTGGPKDGLFAASARELHFTPRSPDPIQCLTTIGSALWACTPARSGYVLGASTDGGATFAPKLTLAGMRGPLRCATPATGATCAADWSALRALVGDGDAGASDGGAQAASDGGSISAPVNGAPSHACGCLVAGKSAGAGGVSWALACAALGGLGARRRKRRG